MFLEWWMLGILAAMTGVWAEYRNIMGRGEGVKMGATAMLQILLEDKVITIDSDGIIRPKTSYREKSSATKRTTAKSRTTK